MLEILDFNIILNTFKIQLSIVLIIRSSRLFYMAVKLMEACAA
jgi:hypothetical protein